MPALLKICVLPKLILIPACVQNALDVSVWRATRGGLLITYTSSRNAINFVDGCIADCAATRARCWPNEQHWHEAGLPFLQIEV